MRPRKRLPVNMVEKQKSEIVRTQIIGNTVRDLDRPHRYWNNMEIQVADCTILTVRHLRVVLNNMLNFCHHAKKLCGRIQGRHNVLKSLAEMLVQQYLINSTFIQWPGTTPPISKKHNEVPCRHLFSRCVWHNDITLVGLVSPITELQEQIRRQQWKHLRWRQPIRRKTSMSAK